MKKLSRRDVLALGAAGGLAAAVGCTPISNPAPAPEAALPAPDSTAPLPAYFISHGSPMEALKSDDYTKALTDAAKKIATPVAIVVVSAHWEEDFPVRITGAARPEMVYDFYNFPKKLYEVQYPSPGAPALAKEIQSMLRGAGVASVIDGKRGYDHGAWVPLKISWPDAKIPVVEVTLPVPRTSKEVFAMGKALAPLRRRGVLLIGSGGITHNFGTMRSGATDVDDWAQEFDTWVRTRIEKGDLEALLAYDVAAPHADLAVPTTEHFDPVFFTLGAVENAKVGDVYEGFRSGNLSMRCFTLNA